MFVGRREHMKTFDGLVSSGVDCGVVVVINGQSGWAECSLALKFKNTRWHHGGLGAFIYSRTAASPEFVGQSLPEFSSLPSGCQRSTGRLTPLSVGGPGATAAQWD